MPTAQELLSSITGPEEHIVIGADRHITVPKPLQRIAVQFDHDVETVTFDCPRYWDDIDMSTMTVYINYKLPNGDLDAYPAKNVKAEGDIMHFDWTISNKVTQYKGKLTFLVCIKKTGTDGAEVNHWNSELCTDMYISEGMECEEQAQMEYSDLITQLLERMTVVEQINVNADEMRETLEEVLNETTGIRQTSANAIKGSASGEIIQIGDVSPVEHMLNVTVGGKNLIPFPYISNDKTENGVTITTETNGGVTFSGVPTAYVGFHLAYITDIPKSDLLYISITGEFTNVIMQVTFYDKNGVNIFATTTTTNKSIDMTIYPNVAKIVAEVKRSVDGVETSGTVYPMLSVTNAIYTPYIDPTAVTVTGCGLNVWDEEWELGGINSVGVNISATDYIRSKNFIPLVEGETYYLNFPKTVKAFYYDADKNLVTVDNPTQTSRVMTDCHYMRFRMEATTYNNDICISVDNSSTNGMYEAYKGGTYTPNADGTCDVVSVSPTMTLLTDTEGITIECEYNKDTNKEIDNVKNAIKEVNGIKYITEHVFAENLDYGIYIIDEENGGTVEFEDLRFNNIFGLNYIVSGTLIVTPYWATDKLFTAFTNDTANYFPLIFQGIYSGGEWLYDDYTYTYANTKYVDEQIASLRDLIGGIENGSY